MDRNELLAHAVSEILETHLRISSWSRKIEMMVSEMKADAHLMKVLALKLENEVEAYRTQDDVDRLELAKQALNEASI